MPRPDAPLRPVCRYYNTTPRGCFEGARCRYLHGDPAVQKYAPYEEEKRCRHFDAGYCKRGKACWFRHVEPQRANRDRDGDKGSGARASTTPPIVREEENEEDMSCGICLEKPALYGLLSGCSHAFCLTCIRRWRDPEEKDADMTQAGIHKTCPMCRLCTKFIIPSSLFYPQEDPRKAGVVERYKQSMARVPCCYFLKSKPGKRFCPFGCDCFYQHANPDGTRHEFAEGVDVMMTQWRRRRRTNTHSASHHPDPIQAALEVLEGFAETLAADDGTDVSGTRRAIIDMHVRDMLRIMGAAPALRTLAQLERMAGADPDELEVFMSGQQEPRAEEPASVAVELASVDADVSDPVTPRVSPASPLSAHTLQDPSSSVSPLDSSPSSASPLPVSSASSSSASSSSASSSSASSSFASSSSPLSPSSPSSLYSSLFSTSSSSMADADSSYESQDPRSPQNASRASQLMSGDFAWMMEERHGTSDGQEGCYP